jgi:predicted RNA polymerase sigma factor
MGLHLAIREEVGTDRPAGIRDVYGELTRRLHDSHAAEHRMIEFLAETLWQSQRTGQPPDEAAYLAALKRSAGIGD